MIIYTVRRRINGLTLNLKPVNTSRIIYWMINIINKTDFTTDLIKSICIDAGISLYDDLTLYVGYDRRLKHKLGVSWKQGGKFYISLRDKLDTVTLAHEIMHVYQEFTIPNFNDLYLHQNKVKGYENNTYELEAQLFESKYS